MFVCIMQSTTSLTSLYKRIIIHFSILMLCLIYMKVKSADFKNGSKDLDKKNLREQRFYCLQKISSYKHKKNDFFTTLLQFILF